MKTCYFMLWAKNEVQIVYKKYTWWGWNQLAKLETTCRRTTGGKKRRTRHIETKTCVNAFIAVRPSRCGERARFSVSLQRQEPVLPTVWDGQISHSLRCKRLQNSLSLPLCPHPSSHSSFLTLVYSFHLHLYSNFYHVTFFIPHSPPTFPLAAYF